MSVWILTDGVADLEPVLRGPVIVEFAVVCMRDDPPLDLPHLELKGGDGGALERREDGE